MSTKSESTISSLSKSPCITVDTSTRIAATPGTASPESTFISNHRTPMPPRIMDTVSPPQPLLATGTITPQTPADERSTTPISLPSMITSSSRNKSVKRHAAGRWTKEEDAKLKTIKTEISKNRSSKARASQSTPPPRRRASP